MRTRSLGRDGPVVSAIGLGCMGMTGGYGDTNEAEAVETIQRAIDLGVTLLNTADVYAQGANEGLVGRAIVGRRDEVLITTKFGQVRAPDGAASVNGRPEYVQQACEASLARLGVDQIDVYCQHRVDPETPIEDTVGAMSRLIEQGKVRYIGLSESGSDTIRRAHSTHPITCLETEYSLWTRDPETEVLPLCRELGIGFVAYSPLGRGFLSGAFKQAEDFSNTDWRQSMPRFIGENFEKNLTTLEQLEGIAHSRGFKPVQLALAWLLAQGKDIIPIPGTRHHKYVEDNARAVNIGISDDLLARLDEVFSLGSTAGNRYPDAQMARIGL